MGCKAPSRVSDEATQYVEAVLAIEDLFRGASLGDQTLKADSQSERDITLKMIEESVQRAKFMSPRERRYTLSKPPTLKFRDFFSLAGCSLSRLIAYRNSPLGRVMLTSQRLAYEQSFLREAARCDFTETKKELKEQIDLAIQHKRKNWSRLHWNAIWGGREVARFLSISAVGTQDTRRFNLSDGATLLWLSQIKIDEGDDLSSELELKLKRLPPYVGGKTLANAIRSIALLEWSRDRVTQLIRREWHQEQEDRLDTLCVTLNHGLQTFGRLQGELSRRYQELSQLSKSLEALAQISKSAPSPAMESYIRLWAHDEEGSAVRAFGELSKESVKLWTELVNAHQCTP